MFGFNSVYRILVCIVWYLLPITIQAHPLMQDTMWLQFEPGLMRVAVNVSAREIQIVQGKPSESIVGKFTNEQIQTHAQYVLEHIMIKASGNKLGGLLCLIQEPPTIQYPDNTFYQFQYEYRLPLVNPTEVVLSQSMLQECQYSAGLAWSVSYIVRYKSNLDQVSRIVLLTNYPVALKTDLPSVNDQFKAGEVSVGRRVKDNIFWDYFKHGVIHILTGYDHLLFISALVIVTLSLWEMAKVILAFTLAHSITLILCVFGILRLPSVVVEPIIALSIIFVALENIFWPKRTHSSLRLVVAFGFGLIHGLGFAGGLLDAMAGLPVAGTWLALTSFSIGVECGNQAVVMPLFAVLVQSRKKISEGSLLKFTSACSFIVAILGVYYLVVAIRAQHLLSR